MPVQAVLRIVYASKPVPADGLTGRSGLQKALTHANDLIARQKEVEAKAYGVDLARWSSLQEMITDKLQRGESLTEAEYNAIAA